MSFVIFDRDASLDAALGGKARALASLRAAELPVPAWFVVTPSAFDDSLTPEQTAALQNADSTGALRKVVDAVRPSPDVERQAREAVTALCHSGDLVAVRSSAS